eukprot:gene25739-11399_t
MSGTVTPLEMTAIGALAGSLEVSFAQPLVGMKNALQEGRPVPRSFNHLYRGLALNIMSMAPITASQFGANRILQQALTGPSDVELTGLQRLGCAMGAGAVSAAVASPSELLIIHQQKSGRSLAAEASHFYNNYKATSLTRGAVSCSMREMLYAGSYLGLCPILMEVLDKNESFQKTMPKGSSLIVAGLTGGIFGAVASQPFDTVKTRMQAHMFEKPEYSSMSKTMGSIYKESGLLEFWKGVVPRTARIICATFILHGVRTTCVDFFENSRAPNT